MHRHGPQSIFQLEGKKDTRLSPKDRFEKLWHKAKQDAGEMEKGLDFA